MGEGEREIEIKRERERSRERERAGAFRAPRAPRDTCHAFRVPFQLRDLVARDSIPDHHSIVI